ncbi:MAG: deoxyhypusine synthase family protein [Candidatus Anstonellales archaeon]
MSALKDRTNTYSAVKDFIDEHFKHFNALSIKLASQAFRKHISKGGKMFLAMAGAMSTAEIGIGLAEMIRRDKVHAISCTGANLEEDIFNLIGNKSYKLVPNYRELTPSDEEELLKKKYSRITDVCIPEKVFRTVEKPLIKLWKKAAKEGKRYFPYEFFYQLIKSREIEKYYQIDIKDSWVAAACEKEIPIFVPGWEDSTVGNFFVAAAKKGKIPSMDVVKTGLETMDFLIDWYKKNSRKAPIGFLQIGGGIAGDFPICVVPLIKQDLKEKCPVWSYFCQISDSTTSYGSYSGAPPQEKITWGKIGKKTSNFIIESDATIVAPLMFAYVLAD